MRGHLWPFTLVLPQNWPNFTRKVVKSLNCPLCPPVLVKTCPPWEGESFRSLLANAFGVEAKKRCRRRVASAMSEDRVTQVEPNLVQRLTMMLPIVAPAGSGIRDRHQSADHELGR